MRIKEKLIYILVPVLLFAGVQIFALGTADSTMPATSTASPKTEGIEFQATAKPHAGMPLISDRTSILKSIGVKNFRSGGCPIIDCAAPPPGCFYQGPPATDQRGCPINCGTLVCDPNGGN